MTADLRVAAEFPVTSQSARVGRGILRPPLGRHEDARVNRLRGRTALALVVTGMLSIAGCGNDVPTQSAADDVASAEPRTPTGDLSAIACATDDPEGVGELTGVWMGSEGGYYYVRQVGACIWWFGTDVRDIEPGLTDQAGFANVASGRISGDRIDLEWADLPLGDTLGGGGLTLVYDAQNDVLTTIEQRGDWQPFGATTFTRIEPAVSPGASVSP
jgi:hypothetical protein